jgi:mannosyltransferase OCH1-like enzyme
MSSFLRTGVSGGYGVQLNIPHHSPATEKVEEESPIPYIVHQCWITRKNCRKAMFETWKANVADNPQFDFYMYDHKECRKFISENFDDRTLWAYDTLVPGAYKADLWRYCVLYKKGGIYADIKFRFRISLQESLRSASFVADVGNTNIYNGFFVTAPENPFFLRAINKIIENVELQYYGETWTDPTGPSMLRKIISSDEEAQISLAVHLLAHDKAAIRSADGRLWLQEYSNYRFDQDLDFLKYGSPGHFQKLWKEKQIYEIYLRTMVNSALPTSGPKVQ